MNTVKGPQNLELHKAQFEMLQKKKILTCHKGIYQELLTFMKTYFQKILM